MQNFLTIDADRFGWRSLRVFNLYRLFVAITLIGLIGAGISPKGDPGTDPLLFLVTSIGYLLIGSIAFLTGRLHYPPFGLQVFSLVFLDVVCILLITHAGGGLDSGFGMLLIPVIAGAGLLVPGQLAVLFAALASLALLGQQALTSLAGGEFGTYTQTGLLGATLFITAVIAMVLARRAQESAELAARRGVDLANLTALNEHIIERMQSGVLVVDDTGNIRLINEAAWRLLGNPGHGNPYKLAQLSPRLLEILQDWLGSRRPGPQRALLNEPSGRELQLRFTRLELTSEPATLISLEDAADISRQLQDEKLLSLGRLTANIAHEIRNPLGAISHAAQLLKESEDLNKGDLRLAGIIHDQSHRVNEIIQDVLRLSRREPAKPVEIRLKEWLETFVDEFMVSQGLESRQLRLHIDPADAVMHFDRGQLHQVLWNLCRNAVKYGTDEPENLRIDLHAGYAEHVGSSYIDVIDHGPGIAVETRPHLFEPFFTTSAHGTGLGLYIARELCENNHARLEYLAVPTGGSCFRILMSDHA